MYYDLLWIMTRIMMMTIIIININVIIILLLPSPYPDTIHRIIHHLKNAFQGSLQSNQEGVSLE